MKRVVKSTLYEVQRWTTYAAGDGAECMRTVSGFSRGAKAYAHRQIALRQKMVQHAQMIFLKSPGDEPAVVGENENLESIDVTVDLDIVV